MYNVLVVDDEAYLRRSLSRFVDTIDEAFKVVASLSDGADAIDFIEKNHVDVVLADIKMEKVSGLELAKYIMENKPWIKVVLISGYKEFEYARKAIEYDVESYLLKPTKLEELTHVFKLFKEKLRRERESQKIVDEWQPLLQEQILLEIILGISKNPIEIQERLRYAKFSFNLFKAKNFILKIKLDNYEEFIDQKWEYGRDRLSIALRNLTCLESSGIHYFQLINRNEEIFLIATSINFMDCVQMKNVIEKHMNEICESAKHVLGLNIKVDIISECLSIMDLTNENIPLIQTLRNTATDQHEFKSISFREDTSYKEVIERAKDYISKNIEKDISLADVANYVFLSPAYFSRFFKQQCGKNFSDYLLEKKMETAISLLGKYKYKVFEISDKVGYKNSKSFNRIFKQYTGYTPMEYCRFVLKKGNGRDE